MDFIEALRYAQETGRSLTKARYSKDAQNTVQWYLNAEGLLVCQNYDYKPEYKTIRKDYWTDAWIGYTGPHAQWDMQYKQDLERYAQLKEELSPILNKLKELEQLERKLGK